MKTGEQYGYLDVLGNDFVTTIIITEDLIVDRQKEAVLNYSIANHTFHAVNFKYFMVS